MIYVKPKINTGLINLLIAIAAVVLFIFHTIPAQKETGRLRGEFEQAQKEIAQIQDEIAGKGPESQEDLSEVDKKELSSLVPEKLNQDAIITNLNAMAKATDISFNALTFSLQKNENGPQAVSIAAGFQGTGDNMTRFLKLIETNSRKFIVKNVSLSKSDANEENSSLNVVNLNLSLQAFYRKDE